MPPMSISEFNNETHPNFLHWRIVENKGRYFVYRLVEFKNSVISEFLQTDGQVDGTCKDGWFANYGEIGVAFVVNHSREQAKGPTGFYTPNHFARLTGQEWNGTD